MFDNTLLTKVILIFSGYVFRSDVSVNIVIIMLLIFVNTFLASSLYKFRALRSLLRLIMVLK